MAGKVLAMDVWSSRRIALANALSKREKRRKVCVGVVWLIIFL